MINNAAIRITKQIEYSIRALDDLYFVHIESEILAMFRCTNGTPFSENPKKHVILFLWIDVIAHICRQTKHRNE